MDKHSLPHDVSVIMVSYQTGAILWRSIESVLVQNELKELIIVDNGNPEDITERLHALAAKDDRIQIISGQGNVGFAAGCNLGATKATGDYLLLLNPDCLIEKDNFSKVITALEASDEHWVAGGCIVNIDGTEQAGSRRNILTPMVALVESLHLYNVLPSAWLPRMNVHKAPSPNQPITVPAISGAFMMMKRDIYNHVGKMDEGYFLHVEDLDFCLQVEKLGGKILHVPDAKVIHYRSTSNVSNSYIERNKTNGFIHYFEKNYKDEYFTGFLTVMSLAIYARHAVRLIKFSLQSLNIKSFITKRANKGRKSDTSLRKALLESYPQFAKKSPTFDGSRPDIAENNSPVMVIGATGQVGLAITRRLLAAKCNIYALYHSHVIDFENDNLTWLHTNLHSKPLNIGDAKPKTLIYTPGLWHLPQHLEQMAAAGVKRLICFSSTSIMGKAGSQNEYEKELVQKFINAEQEVSEQCNALGIEWTIIRPTLIYGIGLDKNISNIVKFTKVFGFFPVAKPASGMRQPVHVDDLAKSVISMLNNPKTFGKRYNLCGGEELSYKEMVGRIFDTLGKPRKILSLAQLPLLVDIYSKVTGEKETNGEIARRMNIDLTFDDSDARNDFSYTPRNFLTRGMCDIEPDFSKENTDASLEAETKKKAA